MTDFAKNGQPIDIEDPSRSGYADIANYSYEARYDREQTLTVRSVEGVLSVQATTPGEVTNGVEFPQCKLVFTVPFTFYDTTPQKMCDTCHGLLAYVGGIRQYLGTNAHFRCPRGWIECKNQYRCDACGYHLVEVLRKYLIVHSGYYVLHTWLAHPPFSSVPRDTLKYRMPTPVYKWEEGPKGTETTKWTGKCLVCGHTTEPVCTDGGGCITGHSSMNGLTVCFWCNLYHYAEEHDD